jgi:carbonic anhydrase
MDPAFSSEMPSPEEALARLREGNRRFMAGEATAIRHWHPGLTAGQRPFAVMLGCSDSRAPAEFVFDQGLGDLFVIRVAGNIVAPSLVGSIEFAVNRFGTRLVVVMGHTHCGAIAATVEAMDHGAPESKNLRSIVDRIAPHLRELGPVPGDTEARLQAAVRANVLASAQEVRRSSSELSDLIRAGRVRVASAVYDLATGEVAFLEQ